MEPLLPQLQKLKSHPWPFPLPYLPHLLSHQILPVNSQIYIPCSSGSHNASTGSQNSLHTDPIVSRLSAGTDLSKMQSDYISPQLESLMIPHCLCDKVQVP